MSREFKFRAVIDDNQIMRVLSLNADGSVIVRFGLESGFIPSHRVKAVLQYTGLKDKNGVEIYEGDIVNFSCDGDNLNFVVSMLKGACFAAHRKSNDSDFYFLDDFEYSVVGNIYENPELLKANK